MQISLFRCSIGFAPFHPLLLYVLVVYFSRLIYVIYIKYISNRVHQRVKLIFVLCARVFKRNDRDEDDDVEITSLYVVRLTNNCRNSFYLARYGVRLKLKIVRRLSTSTIDENVEKIVVDKQRVAGGEVLEKVCVS